MFCLFSDFICRMGIARGVDAPISGPTSEIQGVKRLLISQTMRNNFQSLVSTALVASEVRHATRSVHFFTLVANLCTVY